MKSARRIVVVTQYYPPDRGTTAAIFSTIAQHLAQEIPVVVLSGTAGSAQLTRTDRLSVLEVRNWTPAKGALIKRAVAEIMFSIRVFFALMRTLGRNDAVLTVTAPFMMPYAVVAAARMKRARSALIIHDLYPDALVAAGVIGAKSLIARAVRVANAIMFRALDAIVIIGRDTGELLLQHYGEAVRGKLAFIPNWTTLLPSVRPLKVDNPFRNSCRDKFVVGLSGNLAFTHDPLVVFEAARQLVDDRNIHFLMSGWGIGYDHLKLNQTAANLPNVTFIDRVDDDRLEDFLAAADVWAIPYRKNMMGVSTPSRFYNLIAIGRPVVLVSEPEAEAAVIVKENNIGWVVLPGMPDELANAFRVASQTKDNSMGERAISVAKSFSVERAMASYAALIKRLLQNTELATPSS